MIRKLNILIVDDQIVFSDTLKDSLKTFGYNVKQAFTGETALSIIHDEPVDVIFLDVFLPDINGFDLIKKIYKLKDNIEIIFMSAYSRKEYIKRSLREGSYFLPKPFKIEDLSNVLSKIDKKINPNKNIINEEKEELDFILKSAHREIKDAIKIAEKYSHADMPILIIGENGSGTKELAHFIHNNSNRNNEVFVKCNCAHLPEDLLTYHLSGYEKNAFKGAMKRKHGLFEITSNGTLFIENLNLISIQTQIQLLNVIKNQEIRPIGRFESIKTNVRIIASINNRKDIKYILPDLYKEFSNFSIHLLPLRKRKQDIMELIKEILLKYSIDIKTFNIDKSVISIFKKYHWPRNVYELESVIYRAILISNAKGIFIENLPADIVIAESGRIKKDYSLQDIEKQHIYNILLKTKANKAKAARILGIDRKTLYRKIQKYELEEFYDK